MLVPVYEFVCNSCSYGFDKLCQAGTKAEDLECPECHEKKLKKVFSLFAVSSKGKNSIRSSAKDSITSGKSKCASCRGGSCASC